MTARTITLMLACALATPAFGAPAIKHRAVKPSAPAKPAAAAAPAVHRAAVVAPLPDTPEIARLRSAYAFALPVYEMMRTRYLQVTRAEAGGGPGVNHLYARTTLADASTRDVTTPNNDTLYSSAWLDLAGGPVILEVPPLPTRYNSAALMDLFTDNIAIVGTRNGGKGGRYLIAGPAWQGETPRGTTLIRSTTNDAWLLVRVVVNGAADLTAATGLIRGFTLEVPSGNAAPKPVTAVPAAVPDAANFLDVVAEALARNPLAGAVAKRAADPAQIGVGTVYADVDPAARKLWDRSIAGLRAEIKGGLMAIGTEVDGWSYPGPGIGNFGDDDAGRARVALGGLGALPRTEAVYVTAAVDREGSPLSGAHAYTVHLPPHLPAGAFWSLTMYRQEADGRLFFVDTPSKRYAVNDRSDLHAERDGGFDIFLQTAEPMGERAVNWLPAPKGAFRLVFRAYLPKGELLDGSFHLPPVEISEAVP